MRQIFTVPPYRVALPAAFGLSLLIWGADQLPEGALMTAVAGLPDIAVWRWIAAFGLTGLSFIAMGRLDAVWHVALRLNSQPYIARRAGRIAVAISQCVGASSIVAALLRWRLLRDIATPVEVGRLSLAASLSFMFCWSLAALVALWWIWLAGTPLLPQLTLPLLMAGMALVLWRYGPMLWKHRRLAAAVVGYCQFDLLCAALVFVCLAPADLPIADVIAVFILAVGAGLMTSLPMGLGAFDLVILAFLPSPVGQMLPALLAYRLVFGVLPGIAGLVALRRSCPLPGRDALRALLHHRAPAIWALSRQGASVWQDTSGAALVGQAPFSKVIIGEALNAVPAALARTSRYKIGARTAARLRQRGWSVMIFAVESWIDPQTWSLNGSDRATLRRKLRQAQTGGTTIRVLDPHDNAAELSRIAITWARAKGGERGFSMGRYRPDFLEGQMVYGIYVDDVLRGYVSFQIGPNDWVLDLIRYEGVLPAGAIHAALVAGFEAARNAGVAEVNLGAAVAQRGPLGWVGRRHAGLQQFKGSFSPNTRTLYHAAPDPLTFVWFAVTVLLAVQRPHGRLTPWLGHLSLLPSRAGQDLNVRTGLGPQAETPNDKRVRPMMRRVRLDIRRRGHDKSFEPNAFFRRRTRDRQPHTY